MDELFPALRDFISLIADLENPVAGQAPGLGAILSLSSDEEVEEKEDLEQVAAPQVKCSSICHMVFEVSLVIQYFHLVTLHCKVGVLAALLRIFCQDKILQSLLVGCCDHNCNLEAS